MEMDQVPRIGALVDPAVRAPMEAAIEAEITEAFAFAESSPFPAPAELYTAVYDEA